MRKTYINYLLFSLFAFALLCATSGNIDNREKQVHKIVSIVNLICKETDVMARQSSIEPVRIFVLLTFVLIDCYFVKSYLWKAELPVFWGCKFRIQSPRCKLMKSNICSILLDLFLEQVYSIHKGFRLCFCKWEVKTMDYKSEIIELINNIENEKFLSFIYRMIQSFKKEWGY